MKITLNIGGKIFETTDQTLTMRSEYFRLLFEKELHNYLNDNKEIFIDRSPIAFEYILDYIRNPECRIPSKYRGELDFYMIKYDESDIEEDSSIQNNKIVLNEICKMSARMREMSDSLDKISNILYSVSQGIKEYMSPKREICSESECIGLVIEEGYHKCYEYQKKCKKHCSC